MSGRERFFTKYTLKKGNGLECPNEGSICLINLRVTQGKNNLLTEQKEVEWIVGRDSSYISEILNEILEEMHSGDKLQLSLVPRQELQHHLKQFNISENLPVEYEIELLSFEKAKNIWKFNFGERFQYALDEKAKGTRYYVAGLWLFAARHYSKALKSLLLARTQVSEDTNVDDFSLLQVQCYSNLAACQLKLERYEHVIENCSKVLQMDSANVKAFYRRAQAYMTLNDFEKAESDLTKALIIDPKNKEILKRKKELKDKMQEHDVVTAKKMEKMFKKDLKKE